MYERQHDKTYAFNLYNHMLVLFHPLHVTFIPFKFTTCYAHALTLVEIAFVEDFATRGVFSC